MISFNQIRVVFAAVLLFTLAWPSGTAAADAPKKDAQTVISEMRLKKWTKDLELTDEQQKKVHAIFLTENQEAAKLQADAAISIADRRAKLKKLQEETYEKMKPLLTPAQLEKFEKAIKPAPKKSKPA